MTEAHPARSAPAAGLRLGFLGAGTMGGIIAAGLVAAGHEPGLIGVTSATPRTREELAARLGVRAFDSNAEAAAWADAVVLGVKPHAAAELLEGVREQIGDGTLVISLCAGLSTAALEAHLVPGARVVRVMPNTPSAVGEGMAGISAGAEATGDDLDVAAALMGAVGRAVVIPESQQNALAAISGSGPAWVFHGIESLVEAADEIHVSEGPTHVEQQIDVRTRPVTADGDSNEDSDVRLTRPSNDNAVDPDRYPPSSRGQKHRHMERSRTRPDAMRPRHGLRQAVPAMGGAHDPAHAAQGQPDRADRPGVDTGPRWP